MKAIVNVNESWGIGKDGELLALIPGDMKRFREITKDKAIVVGRTTLERFPGKKPLKGRTNILLTRDLSNICMESIAGCDCYVDDKSDGKGLEAFGKPGATALVACTCLEEVLEMCSLFPEDDIYVCGGEYVYRQMLPYCDTVFVTKNDCKKEADTFFPDLDSDPDWQITEEGPEMEENGIRYRFLTYSRKNAENA